MCTAEQQNSKHRSIRAAPSLTDSEVINGALLALNHHGPSPVGGGGGGGADGGDGRSGQHDWGTQRHQPSWAHIPRRHRQRLQQMTGDQQ